MPSTPIRLNFFAFDNQDITFHIYRQEFHGQAKLPGFYKTKLPSNDEIYRDYWVTFDPKDDFESYYCNSKTNNVLTLQLIWNQLIKRIKESLQENDFIINDQDKFCKNVSIIIANHSEGNEVINLEPYYLKEVDKFGFLVDFCFVKNEQTPYSRKILQLSLSLDKNGLSNVNYYSDKLDRISFFAEKYFHKIFPINIENKFFNIENKLFIMQPQMLQPKQYIFANEKTSNSQFNGLKTYGPYNIVEKEPLAIFIFQESHKDVANELYKAIIGKSFPNTFPGMEKFFNLKITKDNVTKINISSFSQKDLNYVENNLLTLMEQAKDKNLIGIFIGHSREYTNDDEFSPYYYLKYIFTKNNIPLQAVTIEKIKGRDGLKWSASGIGLQLFSKLGGIPWKVKPSNEKCLIFGIGSAHRRDQTTDSIIKYFAYSVCLDSSGIYKRINILGEGNEKAKYFNQLRNNVKAVISENLNNDIEKCIIHLPFKIKKDEMKEIQESVLSLKENCNIEFQFIKINTDNKFFGYAENNIKVPYESSFLQLARKEFLVWFEGLQFGKETISKRVGNPVHIEFLEEKDKPLNKDQIMSYLQDIINLSGANWRGFNAKLSPISIYYPQLIAKYISEFRKFDTNDSLNITSILIPWFL